MQYRVNQLSVHILHSIRHPLQLTCFVPGVNTRQNRFENIRTTEFLLASKIWQVNTINQNEAKLATVPSTHAGASSGRWCQRHL